MVDYRWLLGDERGYDWVRAHCRIIYLKFVVERVNVFVFAGYAMGSSIRLMCAYENGEIDYALAIRRECTNE